MLLKVHCTCKEKKQVKKRDSYDFPKAEGSFSASQEALSELQSELPDKLQVKKCCSTLWTWHSVLKVVEVQDRCIYALNADVLIHWTVLSSLAFESYYCIHQHLIKILA